MTVIPLHPRAVAARSSPCHVPGVDLHGSGADGTSCDLCQGTGICPCMPAPSACSGYSSVHGTRRKIAAGQILVSQGERFQHLYAVNAGSFKSSCALQDGRDQVCGFHLPGEVIALDGCASGAHINSVTALEDSQVCVVPYALLEAFPALGCRLSRLMGQQIVRGHRTQFLLGFVNARDRLAAFLLDLSHRSRLGRHSEGEFELHMSRAEIGSFLGLTVETVSRTLTHFKQKGSLQVACRRIRIVDPPAFAQEHEALLQG